VPTTSLLPANAKTVWDALLGYGATPVEAAGIMGNMLHEDSQMDPELVAMDSNGAYSRGLVMWNDLGAGSRVNWSQYITGNVQKDLVSQAGLVVAQGGLAKAAGATPYDAGVSFAHLFEACAECGYQGSSQLAPRGQSATMVYQVAQSGNWSLGGGGSLPPLGTSPTSPDTPAPAAPTTTVSIPIIGPLGPDVGRIFGDISNIPGEAKSMYTAVVRVASVLINPWTWLRALEVYAGLLMVSAGAALYAVVLAGTHPEMATTIASLIPGEGQVSRAAVGATQAARSGSAARTVAGAASTARRPSGAPRAALRPPSTAGAGRDVRSASRQAAGTARRALPANPPASRPRPRPEPDEDDLRAGEAARQRRSNAAYHRRQMRDTSDLRRRTP
jgi:Phage tail lysozyme